MRLIKTKTCDKCKKTKDNSEFGFRRDRNTYRNTCKECTSLRQKRYREANKTVLAAKKRVYNKSNRKRVAERHSKYYYANKNTIREKKKTYERRRRETDMQFRISTSLRSRLNRAIRGQYKSGSAIKDLGCSVAFLQAHLESLWEDGMSWDNYGAWHIDHIRPLSRFDLTDSGQLKEACHYLNLQPLWAKDNLSKGNKERKVKC